MEIKTITLTGAEQCVTGLDGQNTGIINKSDSAVYASLSPNIVPEADGVIEIAANSRDGLYNTNGTLYLLGTGKVELRGTDNAINFRQPSRSADSGGDIQSNCEFYGDAEFTDMIDSEYAYTVPVTKGSTAAETARNYASTLAELLGEQWGTRETTSGAQLYAKTGAHITITGDNGIISFVLWDKTNSIAAEENYNVSQDNAEHYIDVIKSRSRKVICVAMLHSVMINYVFCAYDTEVPIIWQKARKYDLYRTSALGEVQYLLSCRTCRGDKTALGTGYSSLDENMYNVFSISCAEDFLKNNHRVFMKLNGKNYVVFGRFNDGIISDTINYRTLLAIPLDSIDSGGTSGIVDYNMPYMEGITGLYTANTWNKQTRCWDSQIEGGSSSSVSSTAFVIDDTLVIENEAASVNFSVDKTPRTIYTCVKLNKHSTNNSSLRRYSGIVETFVSSLGNTEPNIYVRYSYKNSSGVPELVFSTGKTTTVSASDPLLDGTDTDYIVICTVLDDNTLYCYLNGDLIKTVAYGRDVNYETTIFLNFTKFLPQESWIDLNKSYKFLAFGDVAHSEDVVKANSEWIQKTFIK